MRPLIVILPVFLLSACAHLTHSSLFRNRTLDYTQMPVTNQTTPVTPANLATPTFAPKLAVPNTNITYPPEAHPDMTPPGFHDAIPVPALPAAKTNS